MVYFAVNTALRRIIPSLLVLVWLTFGVLGQTYQWDYALDPGASMHALPNCMASDSAGNMFEVVEWAGPPGATLPAERELEHGPFAALLPSTDFFVVELSAAGAVVNVWALTESVTPPTGDPSVSYQFYTPTGIVIQPASGSNPETAYVGGTYSGNDGVSTPSWSETCYFLCSFSTVTPSPAGTAVAPTYISTVEFSPLAAGEDYQAAGLIMGPDGYLYLTGKDVVSGTNYMYTSKFSPYSCAYVNSMTGASNTAGVCMAGTGTSTVVIGGEDTNKFALWVYATSGTPSEETYTFSSVAGDSVLSVAINSSGNVFATGTSQTLYSGSFYYQNTSTIESTLSTSGGVTSLGSTSLLETITGNPNEIAANLPTGYPGVDGAQQVMIDPSSTDGKPIVLCTVGGYTTAVKYHTTGLPRIYTTQMYPATVHSGKITTSWASHATAMLPSPANNYLYVAGTGLKSVSNSTTPTSAYLAAKLNMEDGVAGDGNLAWSSVYTWQPSGADVICTALAVYRDSSSVDHIWLAGGYMPVSTAYVIAID